MKRFFSLLELLIVVGIIAILAGTLLPALAKIRIKGYEISCKSNQRQIGIYVEIYGTDTGYYPAQSENWLRRLVAHCSIPNMPFVITGEKNGVLQGIGTTPANPEKSFLICPGFRMNAKEWLSRENNKYASLNQVLAAHPYKSLSYAINGIKQRMSSNGYNPSESLADCKYGKAFAPSLRCYIIDTGKAQISPEILGAYNPVIYYPLFQMWHGCSVNVLFLDMHVQTASSRGIWNVLRMSDGYQAYIQGWPFSVKK